MAAFKEELSVQLVDRLGREIDQVWDGFDRARFVRLATAGLADRELKARATLIADAMVATMPGDPLDADRVVRAVLDREGLPGWSAMCVCEYVERSMLEHPHIALPLLGELTSRWSAEFAIRPFIERHHDLTMAQLAEWVRHPDEHRRRLVSEGTRPRLPWAPVLRGFIADPSPALSLLEDLYDDPSDYVRRSVANHLNDISKDHPELAVATATRWLAASSHGGFVARHGLRTLVKKGHTAALATLGFDHRATIALSDLTIAPGSVPIGGEATIRFTLTALTAARAAIDYVVHYQGVNGPKAGKVFKLTTRDLPEGDPVTIERRHRFEHVSIRRIHPGEHRIEVQVNGVVLGTTTIDVEAP